MENYTYQNTLISKKQLKQILAWSFTKHGCVQASFLADELKYLGFKYATQAGISLSIEDLRVPPIKNSVLQKSNSVVIAIENTCLDGKINEIERFQKVIDTWNNTSETLKDELVSYFKNFDPLNSVYVMAFSGARGNLSQVRQLVGMRGLMSDPNGQIMDLPIKQNFREGLTITDYLISGYGARKGIVDTALKTANSGYLTRRLIDVAQDIIIREKNCLTNRSIFFHITPLTNRNEKVSFVYEKVLGRLLSKSVYVNETNELLALKDTPITPKLIRLFKEKKIQKIFIRSALTCNLNRSICQKCYGWNLSSENLVELGEAIGIIAGQSIGEPGTQLTMRTFHTGGIFTASTREQIIAPLDGQIVFPKFLITSFRRTNQGDNLLLVETSGFVFLVPDDETKEKIRINIPKQTILYTKNKTHVKKNSIIAEVVGSPKQTTQEIKNISSHLSGEISKTRTFQNNTILWILSGHFYNIPITSYLNWYNQIPKSTYICRTKLLNRRFGIIQLLNTNDHFSQQVFFISNKITFQDSKFLKLSSLSLKNHNYLLEINDYKYVLDFKEKRLNNLKAITTNYKIGELIVPKSFTTISGGIARYKNIKSLETRNNLIQTGGTIFWISQETHSINSDDRILLVEQGDKVEKNYEIFPKVFSKNQGIIDIVQKNNIIQEIIIKPGELYKIKNFDISYYQQKIFYPGELIFGTIEVHELSILDTIETSLGLQLLIQPIQIYEIPKPKLLRTDCQLDFINISHNSKICYSENEIVKTNQPNTLIINDIFLNFHYSTITTKNIDIEFKRQQSILQNSKFYNSLTKRKQKSIISSFLYTKHQNLIPWPDLIAIYPRLYKTNSLELEVFEKIYLYKYIANNLNITKLKLTFIIQNLQVISPGIILGYFEIVTNQSLSIINRKLLKNKELLLVTEDDCFNIKKRDLLNSSVKNILWNKNISNRGKILRQNKTSLLIQKGRPYFFPSGTELKLKTGDLVMKGDSIALLTFEKEITGDIVQGLPRIEQILEARKPKKLTKKEKEKLWKNKEKERASFPEKTNSIFLNLSIDSNLHTVLQTSFYYYRYRMNSYEACYRSIKKAQGFIIGSIQSVYQSQGVTISDKHLEIIIKQMSHKVKVIKKGATNLWPKELVSLHKIKYINDSIQENNKKPAGYYPILLGITKASLNSESFISAASFQETTRVLTKAAIEGKIDWLRGLKENVIIGQLIPAGTGYRTYIDVSVQQLNKKSNLNVEINDLKYFFS